ncbi:MAG: hypothetical protein R3D59_05925 [Paracoccaceae bacterium]
MKKMFLVAAMAALSGCATGDVNLDIGPLFSTKNEPAATQAMRWDNAPASEGWTEATLAALDSHGQNLVNTTPADIDVWCPGYEKADKEGRKAFWTGLLSALSKHESTWQPAVVGGGGRWFGLVQISPATARYHGCRAGSGEALKDGAANLLRGADPRHHGAARRRGRGWDAGRGGRLGPVPPGLEARGHARLDAGPTLLPRLTGNRPEAPTPAAPSGRGGRARCDCLHLPSARQSPISAQTGAASGPR